MYWEIRQTVDLADTTLRRVQPSCLFTTSDNNAHRWTVNVLEMGVPVDLSGYTPQVMLFRSDGVPVYNKGVVSGNQAVVTLSAPCNAVHGDVMAYMLLSNSEQQIITIAEGRWTVGNTRSDVVIDGAGVVPSLVALLALFEKLKAYDDVKLDDNLGAANAGKLLYVSADGSVRPLTLGAGLEIAGGVLRVTGQTDQPVQPDDAVLFVDQGDGVVLFEGATFVDQGDGLVLMNGVTATDQGDGVVLMA